MLLELIEHTRLAKMNAKIRYFFINISQLQHNGHARFEAQKGQYWI